MLRQTRDATSAAVGRARTFHRRRDQNPVRYASGVAEILLPPSVSPRDPVDYNRGWLAVQIATFNINNVNKRLANLLDWLEAEKPDVVCLQELKAEDRAFPVAAVEAAGYGAVWRGQRTWNGVAILARDATPVMTRRALPGDPSDHQARYIEAAVNGILVASIYLPNGNPQPGPKFEYKLAWFERLITHAAELLTSGVPVVLAGDYNVVPTEADIWPGHHEQSNALLQPEARGAYRRLLDQGWTDALRSLQPEGPLWTFWGYLRHRWPNDKGMRLDHILLSPSLAAQLRYAGVAREVRGQEGASDHAPTWIALNPTVRRPTRSNPRPAGARRPARSQPRRALGGRRPEALHAAIFRGE
jgi:exodeoxyribonuclease III